MYKELESFSTGRLSIPENVIFLRDLLLSFEQQCQSLVYEVIKKCFIAQGSELLNLISVALSAHSETPPVFPLSAIVLLEAIYANVKNRGYNVL